MSIAAGKDTPIAVMKPTARHPSTGASGDVGVPVIAVRSLRYGILRP
jgi:hypothetical protein